MVELHFLSAMWPFMILKATSLALVTEIMTDVVFKSTLYSSDSDGVVVTKMQFAVIPHRIINPGRMT